MDALCLSLLKLYEGLASLFERGEEVCGERQLEREQEQVRLGLFTRYYSESLRSTLDTMS
jgi:hypothetical protein